jgi:hypothetical protein
VCILSALNATIFSVHYHFDRLPVAAGGCAEITGTYQF